MRNIFEVANQLIETSTQDFVKDGIRQILNSSAFRAPELLHISWRDIHDLLIAEYNNPFSSEEAMKIFVVFTGRSEAELLSAKN